MMESWNAGVMKKLQAPNSRLHPARRDNFQVPKRQPLAVGLRFGPAPSGMELGGWDLESFIGWWPDDAQKTLIIRMIKRIGTSCPNSALPILRARTNFILPPLTFLSRRMAANSLFRCAASNFTCVGRPARWKRPATRCTSDSGNPSGWDESLAAATCPIEIASPCKYLP